MCWFGGSCIFGNTFIETTLHFAHTINHWSGQQLCETPVDRKVGGSIPYKIIVHITSFRHTNFDTLSRNLEDAIEEREDLIEEIQDFDLMKLGNSPKETFWTGRRSSNMGIIMQQLGN